ncbi:uncharacterized protein [Venturia canescens]|uniref:uncharacterized protein n=1 Tax=Venturia canescens TaxID=32260 RepID=UPI001C9C4EE2|nr:uncharacterized protein LOC122410877 [Venturia canescens]
MSKRYYRIKKNRALKNFPDPHVLVPEKNIQIPETEIYDDRKREKNEKSFSINTDRNSDGDCSEKSLENHHEEIDMNMSPDCSGQNSGNSNQNRAFGDHLRDGNSTNNESIHSEDEQSEQRYDENQISFEDKLRMFALKHAKTLRHNVLTDLLRLLRSEGYSNLPQTAKTLLGNVSCTNKKTMISRKETEGSFVYIGIKNQLKKTILPEIYKDSHIKVFVNIDGVQCYNSSNKQFWPIICKVYHENFDILPFVVAIYLGDSKPNDVEHFMTDFISEAEDLTQNGVVLNDKKYTFEIAAMICDAPARAYIKCCKNATGFFACERCVVKGITIENKRVYPEIYCQQRTNESFRMHTGGDHHLPNLLSPLLRLTDFDIIKGVPLDSMHLLLLGVMKLLLEKWTQGKSRQRLTRAQLNLLKQLLDLLKGSVPAEFQRKIFEIREVAKWKATQYRTILLYVGAVVLRDVLPHKYYQHFLLLVVASRILSSKKLAVPYADYANILLREFVSLMPSLYGPGSQVLNVHNLIHISDDVKHFKLPLTEISAFWAENFLGQLKKLIRTPKYPLIQVVKRLTEVDCLPGQKIRIRKKCNSMVLEGAVIKGVMVGEMLIKSKRPDNVVELKDGKLMIINNIVEKKQNDLTNEQSRKFAVEGFPVIKTGDLFSRPDSSQKFGFKEILEVSDKSIVVPIEEIYYSRYEYVLKHRRPFLRQRKPSVENRRLSSFLPICAH